MENSMAEYIAQSLEAAGGVRTYCTLSKLEEPTDALHKNNIPVGFARDGYFFEAPKVGESFLLYNESIWRALRTSTVQEVIDADTFKTYNSIYRINRNPSREVNR